MSHHTFKNIHRYTGNIAISRIIISGFHCVCLLLMLYLILDADFLNLYHQNRYKKKNRLQDLTFDLRPLVVFLFFFLFGYFSFPNFDIFEMRSVSVVKENDFM